MHSETNPLRNAIALFGKYAEPLEIDKRYPNDNLVERLTNPDKAISFRLSIKMDNGSTEIYEAFRVLWA